MADIFAPERAVAISNLGTPVYDQIIFPSGKYTDSEGFEVEYPSVKLDNCLVTVQLQRNIALTNIVGRKGTVKEFISNGDYEITFTGRITAPWQFQPKDAISELNLLFLVEQEISVNSIYLNEIFAITDIVIIGKPTITQVEGSRNTVDYTFQAISYEDIELEVLDA